MDRLTPLDAWFLHVEDGIDHMHMALVSVLEGPCPARDEVLADVAARLDRAPRYRHRVQWAPGGVTAPVWVDAEDFALTDHVRHLAVPPPGDDEALRGAVSRIVEQELDRTRPLWELWVLDGLADGTWATVLKVHHSLTDGVGGSHMVAALMDLAPDADPGPAAPWSPTPGPTPWQLVRDGLGASVADLLAVPRTWRPRGAAAGVRTWAAGTWAWARDLPPTPRTVLNGPLHPDRAWWPAAVARADVDAVRREHGVSLNDVALALVAGGFRDLLMAHGEDVSDRDVRTLVPMSLRRTDRDGHLNNHVAAMVAELPVGIADPVTRLHEVHRRMQALKCCGEADVTATIVALAPHLPWPPVTGFLHLAARVLHGHVQRNVNTVTTNVPGPPVPLWWMGRPILRAWPVVPIGESVRVGVAIYTYRDLVTFGVTTDAVAVPRGDLVTQAIERDLAGLVPAAA